MKTHIERIGNSHYVRIPKHLLDSASLREEVELKVVGQSIVIQAPDSPRAGWAAAFEELAASSEQALLDEPLNTRFDDEEWEWD
ncbi:MAG: hypothetical protein KF813_02895 [Trueperaceae bacterium]|nr:hypothetical protein [Trueperaceae bacterium]